MWFKRETKWAGYDAVGRVLVFHAEALDLIPSSPIFFGGVALGRREKPEYYIKIYIFLK